MTVAPSSTKQNILEDLSCSEVKTTPGDYVLSSGSTKRRKIQINCSKTRGTVNEQTRACYCPVANKKPQAKISSSDRDRPKLKTTTEQQHRRSDELQREKSCSGLSRTEQSRKHELDLSLSVRQRFVLLLEKYWQCGDKSHHNKEMHTLFNSILTYKKLFSTSL